jgi:hypothetical protein
MATGANALLNLSDGKLNGLNYKTQSNYCGDITLQVNAAALFSAWLDESAPYAPGS